MKRAGRNNVIAVVAVMSLILFTACGGKQSQKKNVIEGKGQETDSKMSQEDALYAFAAFTGNWMSETHSDVRLGINDDGSWILYKNGGIYSSGELDYHSEDDSVWISPENNTQWSRLYIEDDGSLYCGPIGTFRLADVSKENISEVEADFGDDWRNSGVVVDSGIITHENEGSVDVLVTVDENSAAFYRDLSEPILFDSVSFPVTIPDAQEYFNDISFDDMDGDGESDVSVSFVYPSGEYTYMLWIWDPEERYVFQWDLSVFANNINEYFGYWEYPDGTVLEISDDGWWYLYEADESNPLIGGLVEFDEEAAYLMNADGSSAGGKVYFDEDGDLIESDYVLTWLGGLQ